MNDDTHVLMYFIFGIIALGAYLYQIYRSMKQLGDRGSMTSVIVNNLIILAIGIVACRYIFPGFFHEVFFEAIWLHINILIYLIVAIVFGCVAYTYYTNERYNLTAIYGVTALAVGICGYLVSNGLT